MPRNLTSRTPLLTSKEQDKSSRRWDADDTTGLRFADAAVVNVEYGRDVQPILRRSCVACHTNRGEQQPAGNLNLDADDELIDLPHRGKFPGTYYRLALDERAQFGHKPVIHNGRWRQTNASRYIRQFQSRRSRLVWKRIIIGMDDYYSGLDLECFTVTANIEIGGMPAGENLAPRFANSARGSWVLELDRPLKAIEAGKLFVSVRDQQGNLSRIERRFSVASNVHEEDFGGEAFYDKK